MLEGIFFMDLFGCDSDQDLSGTNRERRFYTEHFTKEVKDLT